MESARLFLAIDLADAVLAKLRDAIEELRPAFPGARWCRRQAMHLTLKFFGTLPLKCASGIGGVVKTVLESHEPFAFEVKGLGGFPSLENPRVIWAGTGDGRSAIERLASELFEKLEMRGFGARDRRFVPHVTLARMKRKSRPRDEELERAVSVFGSRSFGATEVERVVLYSSELARTGPVYTVVDGWPLGAKEWMSG